MQGRRPGAVTWVFPSPGSAFMPSCIDPYRRLVIVSVNKVTIFRENTLLTPGGTGHRGVDRRPRTVPRAAAERLVDASCVPRRPPPLIGVRNGTAGLLRTIDNTLRPKAA